MKGCFVKRFQRNASGRDFAVGDVHGCFSKLEAALAAIGFDESRDRLFSVGDLVDRGPESERVLEWLDKPWFHPVQGNHEDMAVRFTHGTREADHYLMNGGSWLVCKTPCEQQPFADALVMLPYAIEVETGTGTIGIVHADVSGPTWNGMIEAFSSVTSNNKLKAITNDCLWCRDRIQAEDLSGVPDVRAVIVGHTPLRRPAILGNVYHIDTAGWTRDGYFTFIELETLDVIPPKAERLFWEGD
ncbi:serine/threonine protein phosphatase [Burkholderia multivorans]|uniref:metallophosphoesterase n=1 Tax=Burkholderia multivorans TaxID=87883 RepID=UPI00084136E2|nr:metallophosphoesterase [Burkholderia multivorans]AOJ93360.1 serine/threonine protein phosphatase [Burkholderia multivorans]MBU9550371.1 metallophosphoesterase [Burkholderia multivorans]